MDGTLGGNYFASLVDDRVDEGVFRVDRAIYSDDSVFESEIRNIFEGGWVYLCHESQVAKPGDYYAAEMGRQPVFVIRQKDGGLACFINACSHRAAILTPFKQGNAPTLTCRFHGWSYGADGRCVMIKNQETGYPDDSFDRNRFNLRPIARLDAYQGFVFGSLNRDVPSLDDYLGPAKSWIDLLAVQSPEGLEVVPGTPSYAIEGNWKLQVENSVDGYHVSTVHRVFAATIASREGRGGTAGMGRTESARITSKVPTAGYDLGNGHMAVWAQHTTPEVRPIYEAKDRLERDLPPAQVDWILNRGRNLCLFPNVVLMDNPSTQIRVLKPIGPDRTEVTVHCIAPIGESDRARIARLRKFEDFYLTAGMATSDDIAALEAAHEGSRARNGRWNEFKRGIHEVVCGADDDAKALGFEPATSATDWEHEVLYHGMYRHWLNLMTTGSQAS